MLEETTKSTRENGILNFDAENSAIISGVLAKDFEFSHINPVGRKLLRSEIYVERDSGTKDIVPLIVPEDRLPERASAGMFVELRGCLSSYHRYIENGKRHLDIFAYPHELHICESEEELQEEPNSNKILLNGIIIKKTSPRETPFGRIISDLVIKVPRSGMVNRYYYFPCIAWGKTAMKLMDAEKGDHIKLLGRFQSRTYFKRYSLDSNAGEERIAYEISIMRAAAE